MNLMALKSAAGLFARLSQALHAGAPPDQLDALAGRIIQHMGTFRVSLRTTLVHRRALLPEMLYDGPACLADDGKVTDDPAKVTCPKCRSKDPDA